MKYVVTGEVAIAQRGGRGLPALEERRLRGQEPELSGAGEDLRQLHLGHGAHAGEQGVGIVDGALARLQLEQDAPMLGDPRPDQRVHDVLGALGRSQPGGEHSRDEERGERSRHPRAAQPGADAAARRRQRPDLAGEARRRRRPWQRADQGDQGLVPRPERLAGGTGLEMRREGTRGVGRELTPPVLLEEVARLVAVHRAAHPGR